MFGRFMMRRVAIQNTREVEFTADKSVTTLLLSILEYNATDRKDLLNFALDKAIELTESKIGYIYHYSEDRKEFVLNTWSKEVMNECRVNNPGTIYKLESTGIWGEVVRQRKPIILNNYQAPHPLKKGYPEGHAKLHKFMSIPVFNDNSIVMVVGVANKELDYTNSDIANLNLFMSAVREILHQFDYLDEIKKQKKELEETLENFYTLRVDMLTQMEKGTMEEENKKIKEKLESSRFYSNLLNSQ